MWIFYQVRKGIIAWKLRTLCAEPNQFEHAFVPRPLRLSARVVGQRHSRLYREGWAFLSLVYWWVTWSAIIVPQWERNKNKLSFRTDSWSTSSIQWNIGTYLLYFTDFWWFLARYIRKKEFFKRNFQSVFLELCEEIVDLCVTFGDLFCGNGIFQKFVVIIIVVNVNKVTIL